MNSQGSTFFRPRKTYAAVNLDARNLHGNRAEVKRLPRIAKGGQHPRLASLSYESFRKRAVLGDQQILLK